MTATLAAGEFDRMFDAGEDMTDYLDWDSITHDELPDGPITVSVTMETEPSTLAAFDRKAARAGMTRGQLFRKLAYA